MLMVMHAKATKADCPPFPESLLKIMFDIMAGDFKRHETLCKVALAMCSANACYEGNTKDNLVIKVCIASTNSNSNSEHWGEAVIHEFNEGGRGDETVLKSVIKVITDIYSEKMTSNFFYTNDMHVIVDIIIREVQNLPASSALRVDYLILLEQLLQKSCWFAKNQYRREEICEALNGIIEAYDNDTTFNRDAYDMVRLAVFFLF